MREDSIRGWIAIGLVAVAGLGSSLHSYYAGQADALVMQSEISAMKADVQSLQDVVIALTGDVTRLTTLHEQRGTRRRR